MEQEATSSAPYLESLKLVYGKSVVKKAFSMLAGEDAFSGLPQASDALEGFRMHTALLAAYQKLQDAKATHAKG